MTDFVAKPLDVPKLIATILRYATPNPALLSAPESQGAPGSKSLRLTAIAETLGLERQRLAAIADDGDESLLPLLRSLADSALTSSQGIREAIGEGDRDGAARLAHSLRGSSANFGAGAIAAPAGELEERLRDGEPLADLKALVSDLAGAADTYASLLETHFPAPAGKPGEGVPDMVQLQELVGLLRHRNMAALDLFDELTPALRGHWAEESFRQVEAAMSSLAFENAADLIALAKQAGSP